jgi:uncharacterized OsmC-like protein
MNEVGKPKWAAAREAGPIVVKAKGPPQFKSLAITPFARARAGEPIRFEVYALAEPTSLQGKRAIIGTPLPGWSNFEIFCDEGTPIGGEDTAPSPLGYLTAAVAFCLLTHVSGFLRLRALDIDQIRVEIKGRYSSTMDRAAEGGHAQGACEGFETHVIVESPEPAEKIKDFIAACEDACIAMQTVMHAVPASTRIVLNGKTL